MNRFLHLVFTIAVMAMSALPSVANNLKLYGKVTARGEGAVPFAVICVEGGKIGTYSNDNGDYELELPLGRYVLVFTAMGYEPIRKEVYADEKLQLEYNVELLSSEQLLDDVVVTESSSGVSRLRNSAYNVVALDTKEFQNSTGNLSDILSKSPGVRLRESGGEGSGINLMLDGFSSKHIKIFIDGVPQEGVGASFGLNNIPVNLAERIEVYRGVVPVQFGADAMGGVVNIVTNSVREGWNLDASYSYGSFNIHKSFINFGKVHRNGLKYELNIFQNYSDNNYTINAPVEDFETGSIEKKKLYSVERFNDTYHNEAATFKVGVVGKSWADRLMLGLGLSNMYKEVQTGVRQEIVYGQKHRRSHSLMPSLEYGKRNLLLNGLDLSASLNYNCNVSTNIDTASCKYNWFGETKKLNGRGEQSLQHLQSNNENWNLAANFNYSPGISHRHLFTLNYLFSAFRRSNTSLLLPQVVEDPIDKLTRKNIVGLSYRLTPSERWNITAFGKYYNVFVQGPVATTSNADEYVRDTRAMDAVGYGAAGTYFILPQLQVKLSYEKACRMPTIEEMFGDEDLEQGEFGLRPERSHNVNLNVGYNGKFAQHGFFAEAGLVLRDTRDYIQRNIVDLSGGKSAATYINYGKVLTKGYNVTLRYTWDKLLSIGGNFTDMRVLDNMKTAIGSSVPNLGYGGKMPNMPSMFADFDVTLYWHGLGGKDNLLTFTYDGQYVQEFSYYSARIGSNNGDYIVPDQLSHNISLVYSLKSGRYNIALECRNVTDEHLYDNFSLQKPGRAFYAKFRVKLGK